MPPGIPYPEPLVTEAYN